MLCIQFRHNFRSAVDQEHVDHAMVITKNETTGKHLRRKNAQKPIQLCSAGEGTPALGRTVDL